MDSTLIAALIGAGGAAIAVVIAKDTEVSKFRQAWIDALRQDLAEQFSVAGAIFNARSHLSTVGEKLERLNVLNGLIRLRMDLTNPLHSRLNREVNEISQVAPQATTTQQQMKDLVYKTSNTAAEVLDEAWETVKKGEPRYNNVLKTAVGVLIVAGVLFGVKFFLPSDSQNIVVKQPVQVQMQNPQATATSVTAPASLPAATEPVIKTSPPLPPPAQDQKQEDR